MSQASSPPLQLLKSGQLLSLTADSQGWLLIQKPYFAEFAGPGAAVGGSFDIKCTSVYVIGNVKFQVPETHAERQQSYQQRITYIEQLQEITSDPSPLSCAHTMVNQLNQWCGVDEVKNIPNEWIAQLIGALPQTVAAARQHLPHGTPTQTSQVTPA